MSFIKEHVVGLDFETYSDVDLRKHGLMRYVSSPNFKVLIASVSMIDEDDTLNSVVIDFVQDHEGATVLLEKMIDSKVVVAHNAAFEWTVLDALHIHRSPSEFLDSAVFARIAGMGSSLEAAAPQALGVDKMESGKNLIQLFSIPGTYQMDNENTAFDPKVVEDHPEEWAEFIEYCGLDSALSLKLLLALSFATSVDEMFYTACTLAMNNQGWHVDVPLVEEMDRRYQANQKRLIAQFQLKHEAYTLNLNSSQQLVQWCSARGVRASSFDEQHVASMMTKLEKKLESLKEDDEKRDDYEAVLDLLQVKQAMGGSSLKKLRTILDTVSEEGLLYDQYLHAGASTTLRTTGRSVQMQNLKRLGGKGDDVEELKDPSIHWDNAKMARNLRQVFTASHEGGSLVVGDYSAVESRGLAWLAGEEWKLDAYRNGIGVYEKQASEFYEVALEDVSPEQRSFAKVGELSGGYGAGAVAVQEFAEKMGVHLTLGEAQKLVHDFRGTNPCTVAFWQALSDALLQVSEIGLATVAIPHGTIMMETLVAPPTLQELSDKKLSTLVVKLKVPMKDEVFMMNRMFHGFSMENRTFTFWKPSARKTGDLWTPTYIDPKTGRRQKYTLYGGKMAGILTQSLCREIFMRGMSHMTLWTNRLENVSVIGQFHDELVLDWAPPSGVLDPSLDETVSALTKVMSHTDLPEFPLDCAVKTDYRYTK